LTHYSPAGGITGGRPLDLSNPFELAIEHRLGDKIRATDVWAEAVWSAIANTRWEHTNGDTAIYTIETAGDVIAAIRGAGDYRYWHISGRLYKSIPGFILKLMAQEGWKPKPQDPRDRSRVGRGGAAVPVCCPGSVKAGSLLRRQGRTGAQGMFSFKGPLAGPWG